MKKIIIFVTIFLLQISTLFADSLINNFPQPFFAFWSCDAKFASEILGYTDKDNEVAKAFKEIYACFKERFSIDLEKEFETVSVFAVPGTNGISGLGVFSGKFNTNNLVKTIKSILPKEKSEDIRLETTKINDKEIQVIVYADKRIIFYNEETILFAPEGVYPLIGNSITFTKAPQDVAKLMEKNKRLVYIPKASVMFLSALNLPPELISGINSIAGFIDSDFVNIEMAFNDSNSANHMLTELKKMIKAYSDHYSNEFEKRKKSLDDVFVGDLSEQILGMYLAAKGKDFIDSLNFEIRGNNLVVTTKAEGFRILTGIVGSVASAFAPGRGHGPGHGPGNPPPLGRDSKYACYSNIRVLTGAVEMYNMDHATMMSTLDTDTLVKEHYLKYPPKGPDPDCEYYSEGDLIEDGIIACKKHGALPKR